MRVVFCSSVFDMSEYEKMRAESKITLSLADHNLNFNFIKGLDSLLEYKVELINRVPTPTFPAYRKIWIKNREWHHTADSKDIDVGFVNLPILKQIMRSCNIYHQLKKKVKASKDEKLVIMTYDVHLEHVSAMVKIKKKFPNIITCMIMPDIPTQMLALGSPTNIQRLIAEKKMQYVNQMDAYVFLTKFMKECVDVSSKKYTVVEGIYDDNFHQVFKDYKSKDGDSNVVLYAGNLREAYGIMSLIEAVQQLVDEKGNYELWICGQGELDDKISAISKDGHPWLKYFGYVTPPRIYELFVQATVLVNPRLNNMAYTRYSFPSKTLEYLATGKPLIAYKLDGIPDDYDKYINYVEEEGDVVLNLRDKISEVCSLPFSERLILGEQAKNFVLEKSPARQCSKIIEMLSTID